jgi:hypothetical protein
VVSFSPMKLASSSVARDYPLTYALTLGLALVSLRTPSASPRRSGARRPPRHTHTHVRRTHTRHTSSVVMNGEWLQAGAWVGAESELSAGDTARSLQNG